MKTAFKVIAYYCFKNEEGEWRESSSSMIVEAKGVEEAALSGFVFGERVMNVAHPPEKNRWNPYIGCVKVYDWKLGTTDGVKFEPDRIVCFRWEWKLDRGESLEEVKVRLNDEIKSRKGRRPS